MNKENLDQLFSMLTFDEKIGQMIQLTGDFFSIDENVMDTGPMKKLGLKESFDIYELGSILNITDRENTFRLQKEYLERATHKIPLLFMADIIYGYKSIFPIPLAQTCSWNFDLIERSAEAIAKECYEAGIHVTFAPMVDIARDARWGRVMESPGEDVFLAKKYAKHMVRGIQGTENIIKKNHVAACVKHFAAYGAPRAGREYNSVELSPASLHNTYLPSYKAAIDEGVKLVMTAFNTLNGIPATGNKWLNFDLLRQQYGFEGLLISDYAAVEELKYHGYTDSDKESAKKALESTVDIDMKTSVYANELSDLIKEDNRIIELVDKAAYRVLTLKNELGLFEDPYRGLVKDKIPQKITESNKELMSELARESIVLLKNESLLPLNEKKIGLIGPYSEEKSVLGFWAITGDESDAYSLKEGLEEHSYEERLNWSIKTALGTPIIEEQDIHTFGKYSEKLKVDSLSKSEMLDEALNVAKNSDVIILALGESAYQSGEGGSRAEPRLPSHQVELLKELKQVNKPIVLVVFAGRPLILDDVLNDVDSVIYAWFSGTMSGKVLSEIISGKINPSGKLSMTFPKTVGQIPISYSEESTGRPNKKNERYHRFASRYLDVSNQPLFPFGYGLSYSEIEYKDVLLDEEHQKISIRIENKSNLKAKETVQLYVQDMAASLVRPTKELRDFKKVSLLPNETKVIEFALIDDLFSFYDVNGNEIIEEGEFTIFIGKDSSDDRFQIRLYR